MSEVTIRIATVDDVEAYYHLMHTSFQEIRDLDIDWPSAKADRELVKQNIEQHTTYVLEKDGHLISTITIRFPWMDNHPTSTYPFVWWFGTDPAYAGKGYGNQLLTYVEEHVLRDTLKAPAVTLGTSARKHPWLLAMYERKGYTIFRTHESADGDLGALLYKVLIPERFQQSGLEKPETVSK